MTKTEWKYNTLPGEEVDCVAAKLYFNEDGVLIIEYKINIEFSLDKAKEMICISESMTNSNKVPVMVITGRYGEMHSDTLTFLASNEPARHRKATALIIGNLPHRLMAGFILRKREKYYPTKIFGKREAALTWLQQYNPITHEK